MAWNDPGKGKKNGNGEDPWGKNGGGPPDLDEALKQLQRKIAGMFGGGRGSKFDFGGPSKRGSIGFWLVGILILAAYLLSGIYIVQPYEVAVVKRFGAYNRTEEPGPHWIPWLIETRKIVNVDEVKPTLHGGQMLTQDENIIDAKIAVQFRVRDAKDYLFNVVEPEETLRQVSESALRSVVGQSTLNEVLTSGRAEVNEEIRTQIVQILDSYGSGLEISDVAIQQTKAPDEVKPAFDDAIKAQQDEERYVNEARAYSNQRVPIAQGQASRILQEAQAYKQQQILWAKGETAKFEKLLPEYIRQPEVFRDRLYFGTLEEVLSKTNKILIDVDSGNNLMVLPLEQLLKNKAGVNINLDEQRNNLSQADYEKSLSNSAKNDISSGRSSRPTYEDISRYRLSRGE